MVRDLYSYEGAQHVAKVSCRIGERSGSRLHPRSAQLRIGRPERLGQNHDREEYLSPRRVSRLRGYLTSRK